MRYPLLAASRLTLLGLVLVATASIRPLAGQSGVPASAAPTFLGTWELPLESPTVPWIMNFEIEDIDGQITVRFIGDEHLVVEVSKPGEELRLEWSQQVGGMTVGVVLVLVPSGEELLAEVDVGDGMLTSTGLATRR